MTTDPNFADRIKQLRLRSQLSRQGWALKSGISRITLWRWEKGQVLPRDTELHSALKALGLDQEQRRDMLLCLEQARGRGIERMLAKSELPLSYRRDVLRAVRMRKGWSQERAASEAGISRPTLLRWERGDSWPSTDRLQALCFSWEVNEREFAALTTVTAELASEEKIADFSGVRDEIRSLETSTHDVDEIRTLELAAFLSARPKHTPEVRSLLCRVYLSYAHALLHWHRFREASDYLVRTRQLLPSSDADLKLKLTLVEAYELRIKAFASPPSLRRIAGEKAFAKLRPFLPSAPLMNPSDQSDFYGSVAMSLLYAYRHEEALKVSALALEAARETSPVSGLQRLTERHWIYRDAGLHAQILTSLPDAEVEDSFLNISFQFNGAQALIDLGEKNEGLSLLRSLLAPTKASHFVTLARHIEQTLAKHEG